MSTGQPPTIQTGIQAYQQGYQNGMSTGYPMGFQGSTTPDTGIGLPPTDNHGPAQQGPENSDPMQAPPKVGMKQAQQNTTINQAPFVPGAAQGNTDIQQAPVSYSPYIQPRQGTQIQQ